MRIQRTNRLTAYIAYSLHEMLSIKAIAERTALSEPTIHRVLDTISCVRPKLPRALAIDEFKGNADTGKYQCILVDPEKSKILDILPDRRLWKTFGKDFRRQCRQLSENIINGAAILSLPVIIN